MRPEGQEDDGDDDNKEGQDELFDDVSEKFLRCALHQGVNFFSSLSLNYSIDLYLYSSENHL